MYAKISGQMRDLWRAVDHDGEVLESFVARERHKAAALKFQKKLKRHGRPRTIVADGLRSCGAALNDLGAADRQETGRWLDNQAENSHLPFRRRERTKTRLRRMKTLQKSSSVHASVHDHFSQERHLVSRDICKQGRSAGLAEWRAIAAQKIGRFGLIAHDRRPARVGLTAPLA